ncbi:MAG TPA: GTPase Era [Termitinemataceae bacterium]|nr:GTPase Era [Termitinemataceae bacterium]HOM23246.1 GTPase Era [Termitinemataceae bacterium]HPQ00206.1 GTPase Era [Termitinemataceae bacterium]
MTSITQHSTNEDKKKVAFVALVGRPSAGKSTLLNTLCGYKVAIVSPIPQTTRHAVRGILTRQEGQLIFVDTPGLHLSEKKMNVKLIEVAERTLEESDLVLYVIDASREPGPEESFVVQKILEKIPSYGQKMVVAINKVDAEGAKPEQSRTFIQTKFPDLQDDRLYLISALRGDGVAELTSRLFALAPEGELLYPEDTYTDQDVPFRIAEIIREQAILRLRQEIPHCIFVEVADVELREEGTQLWIRAFILVERESQKGIVVGKGGRLIKEIRQASQRELQKIFDWKIYLDLRVKTAPDWRQDDKVLKKLLDR